jgi:hypothetical protein
MSLDGNRRRWNRIGFDGTVDVVIFNEGENFTITCSVLDYTDEGMGLESPRSIAAPSEIQVIIGQHIYQGTVRYSRKIAEGLFRVGLTILPPTDGALIQK